MIVELTHLQIETRQKWVEVLENSSTTFTKTTAATLSALKREVEDGGFQPLLSHVRFCGTIPERYRHDSTEEKAYSKYTDAVVAEALQFLGLNTIVLEGRADMADVEAAAQSYNLVADAKAFRMTRTAKNQKDFKIAAMDRWRYDKKYALVVAPIDHLPARSSQIYLDASSRNVCILSYSHLAALLQAKESYGEDFAISILERLLAEPAALNPSKDALGYWRSLNSRIIDARSGMSDIWRVEKAVNMAVIKTLKDEGLQYLAEQRSAILAMSHGEAIQELITKSNIDAKAAAIKRFTGSTLLDVGV